MLRSLFSGVSGLRGHQTRMDVIGNNIANINTLGFKAGRVPFQEVMAQTLKGATRPTELTGGTNPIQVGLGMSIGTIDNIFSQGTLESTGNVTDLAIVGDAMFILSDGNSRYYTRTGGFQFDGLGRLVDPGTGLSLQGVVANSTGQLPPSSQIGDITLPLGQKDPAKETTRVEFNGNLDSSKEPLGTITDSQGILSLAQNDDDIFRLHDNNGMLLGLADGDDITLKANASGVMEVRDMYDSDGVNLGLSNLDEITVSSSKGSIDSGIVNDDITAFSFVITVTGYKDTPTPYTVNINSYTGQSPEQNVADIRSDISRSGAPIEFIDNKDGTFTIEARDQTTDILISGDPLELAQIGLDDGVNIAASYREVDISSGETYEDFLLAVQTALGTEFDVIQNDDGSFYIQNNGTTDASIEIKAQIPTNSVFDRAVADLQGELEYGRETKDSDKFKSITTFEAGTDFVDLDELASVLESALQKVSPNATVNYIESTGKLEYTNQTSATVEFADIMGIEIVTNPPRDVFISSLNLNDNDLLVDSTINSNYYLDVAEGTDSLGILYSNTGNFLELDTGDINIEGKVGDVEITPQLKIIGSQINTLEDLAEAIKEAFGIQNTDGVVIDSDGSIKITGDQGASNAITNIKIYETGNSAFSTVMAFNEIQMAKDITAAASVLVYDSLGDTHQLTITFTKAVVDNRWNWEVTTGEDEVITAGSTGVITFNSDGSISGFYPDDGSAFKFEPGNGADPMEINILAGILGDVNGITQFASPSTLLASNQNGWANGDLATISIGEDGTITGLFTNSVTRTLAQVFLAKFPNASGLNKVGDNLYMVTGNSGNPLTGTAEGVINSTIQSGSLEMSNVDLAQEFTNMIITQRGFQANARIISTSDEMLTELVNLKR